MGQGNATATEMDPADVRDYLLQHPDFLSDNTDVLENLVPPVQRRGDSVEDFQRYMLARLQDNLASLRGEHDDLMGLLQEQMQRQGRLNAAVQTLLDAPDLAALVQCVARDLPVLLDHATAGVFLEAGNVLQTGDYEGLRVVEDGFVARFLGDEKTLLEETPEALAEIHGEKADEVRSHALVRLDLGPGVPQGLLALGHRDPMHYATGLAAEQVECLASVLTHCMGRWLV